MSNKAGILINIKRLAKTIIEPKTRDAVLDLENKILELDSRLVDAERRLKAGGL